MNTDDKIRAILTTEADAVDPSPAGWDAITTGIAARRRRNWWVRGGALATAALTVAAVAFVATNDPSSRDSVDQTPTSPGPSSVVTSEAPSPTPSASPTVAPVVDEPTGTIWPLTTTGEVAAWEADRPSFPSLATVNGSSLGFARTYLGIPDATVDEVALAKDGTATVEVRRAGALVTTLEVRGYGADGMAPYLVRSARSEAMEIDTPTTEARVTAPAIASGTYRSVDPAFTVTLRADGAGSAPVDLVSRRAETGPPNVWDAFLDFTTKARTGSVLITDRGGVDGGVIAAAAVPVTFGASAPSVTPSAPAEAAPLGTYVGVRDRRVAVFTVGSATPVRYLTEELPGGGPSSPDLSPDRTHVAWVQGGGTCATALLVAPVVGGGEPVALKTPTGGLVTDVAWAGNGALAYAWQDCEKDAVSIRLHAMSTGSDQAIGTTTAPRAVAGSPDGKFVAWATETTLVSYEVASRKASTLAGRTGCTFVALDVPEVTSLGFPVLLSGHYCGSDPQVLVEQGTPHAPGRDTVAEIERDGMVWRISRDSTGRLLVSHGLEDAPPYVEFVDREGKHSETRNVDDASW